MIETTQNIHRHPEWKRLYDALVPLLSVGAVFSYETIRELMGLDARTSRGRKQFHRCAKEIARDYQFHMECVKNEGYRVVAHDENTGRMHNRMGRAKRRLRDAAFIGVTTKLDELTEQQRAANADILARIGRLTHEITESRREIRKIIVNAREPRLPHPLLVGDSSDSSRTRT